MSSKTQLMKKIAGHIHEAERLMALRAALEKTEAKSNKSKTGISLSSREMKELQLRYSSKQKLSDKARRYLKDWYKLKRQEEGVDGGTPQGHLLYGLSYNIEKLIAVECKLRNTNAATVALKNAATLADAEKRLLAAMAKDQ